MKHLAVILLLATSLVVSPAAADSGDGEGQGRFTIQVASFGDRPAADRLANQLPDAWIQVVRQDGTERFRVNFRRFDDRTEAVLARWDLEDLGFKGFIQKLYI